MGHFVMIAHHPSHQSTYSKSLGTDNHSTGTIPIEGRSQDRAKLLGYGISYREEPKPTYAP